MIRTTLEFLKKELELYIVEREQDPANYAVGNSVDILPVVKSNGDYNLSNTSHITIMLVGIEEERREGKRQQLIPIDDNNILRLNPPIEIDLQLLFIANNGSYETALRDISSVICFFQAFPVFDELKFPGFNSSVIEPNLKPWQLIKRLSFHLYNLTFEQQNNLWAMLGGKYIPSVVYQVKLLTVFEHRSDRATTPIKEMNYNN